MLLHHLERTCYAWIGNPQRPQSKAMSKTVITGWMIELAGTALWLYGYFATGNPSLIDWQAHTPWWIADCLPNVESEIGMVLVFAGMVPLYWPARRSGT